MLKRLSLASRPCLYISLFCLSWAAHAAEQSQSQRMNDDELMEELNKIVEDREKPINPSEGVCASSQSSSSEIQRQEVDPKEDPPQSIILSKIKKHGLSPLGDTEWSHRHPNQLPYGECLLTNTGGNWSEVEEGGILFSSSNAVDYTNSYTNSSYTLFCYNKVTKSAYMVPVTISSDYSLGLSISFAHAIFRAKIAPKKGARLSQVFGRYRGFGGGLGYLVTMGGASLTNAHGYQLSVNTCLGVGGMAGVAYRSIKMKERKLNNDEIYSPEYLAKVKKISSKLSMIMENFTEENPGAVELAKSQHEQVAALHAWPAERKYNNLHRYWVHHLSGAAKKQDIDNLLSEPLAKDLLDQFQFLNVQ